MNKTDEELQDELHMCHEALAASHEKQQALAAHVELFVEFVKYVHKSVKQNGEYAPLITQEMDELLKATPTTSLARRDLIKQAEALEDVEALIKADARNEMHGYALHLAAGIVSTNALALRQQAAKL